MYKIRNKSLDHIYSKYEIQDLSELNNDQLIEICVEDKNLNAHPKHETTERKESGSFPRIGSFDRYRTIEGIIEANSFSEYMGSEYWNERHREIAAGRNLLRTISEHKNGNETLQLFQECKMGFFKLKPGDEIVVDVSPRWVKDYLMAPRKIRRKDGTAETVPSPHIKKLEVVDLEAKKGESSEAERLDDKRKILEKLDYKEKQKMAKERGLKYVGVSDKDLIESLLE